MFGELLKPLPLAIMVSLFLLIFIIPLIINLVMVCKVWQIGKSARRISASLEQIAAVERAKYPG
jgi:hypothetical protein